jgi:DNA primase
LYHPQERRVIFPIEVDGRPVGWQARTIDPTEWYDEETRETKRGLKVTTPKGVQRDRVLKFQDRLKGSEHAVLTEGPVDGVKCHRCGGNVVSMGKSLAPGQLEVLHQSGIKRIFLALDPDAAAEVSRLCREFSGLEVFLMQVPNGERVPRDFLDPAGPTKIAKDFGDMSVDGVYRAFLSAKRVNAGHSFMAPFVDFMTAKV